MTTENTMILDTTKGKVVIEMRPDLQGITRTVVLRKK